MEWSVADRSNHTSVVQDGGADDDMMPPPKPKLTRQSACDKGNDGQPATESEMLTLINSLKVRKHLSQPEASIFTGCQ